MKRIQIAGLAAAAVTTLTLTAGVVGAAPSEVGAPVRASGPTFVHDAAFTGTEADVLAVTTGSGQTVVTLRLGNLPAAVRGTSLGAHVHIGACGSLPGASGGHYVNPSAPVGTPLHDKEIWLDVDVNDAGNARSVAIADWVIAPGAAKSVVVHALTTDHHTGAAGPRLFCTDVPFGGAR